MLTQERLKELVHYDQETGLFTWNKQRPKCRPGDVAGTVDGNGYVRIKLDRRDYAAHRLAFLYVLGSFPDGDADHRDLVRTNNAWGNLRPASHSQNQWNKGPQRNNTSGVVGVSWYSRTQQWRGKVKVNGRSHSAGYHSTLEQAAAAVANLRATLHGEFARAK